MGEEFAELARHDSDTGVPPSLTLHAHCGPYAAALRRCVKAKHGPSVDHLQLPEGSLCEPLLEEFKMCGRDFLQAHLEAVESKRCAAQIKAARECALSTRKSVGDCGPIEMEAIMCLSRRVVQRMATARLEALASK